MQLRYPLCLVVFVLGLLCLLPAAHADSWLPPKPSVTYESAAGDARFTVTTSGRTNSLVGCRGTLLVKNDDSQWHQLWDKPLQNPLAPVRAVVADGGWRVITFDNYYSVGYGDEVIVFYNETGDLIKKYSLEDLLSKEELDRIPRSVSSRWWRSQVRLDEPLGVVTVDVVQSSADKRSLKSISFDLGNGRVLSP
jgi:hypothetical protein